MPNFEGWAGDRSKEEESRSATVETFVVINSILQCKARGIRYRGSPIPQDKLNKVASFGSVIRGVHQDGWVKVAPGEYLPLKLDGLHVLIRRDNAGLPSARQEVSDATVHFRLQLSGCRHRELAGFLQGTFVRIADNHGRAAFSTVEGDRRCYYWDKRDGPQYSGWYLGAKPTAGIDAWAFNPCNDWWPPERGWQVPCGQKVDNRLCARLMPTTCVTVSKHMDPSYNGAYELQAGALNGHPWFRKTEMPARVLYCFVNPLEDQRCWNLDDRDSPGSFNHAHGGRFMGALLPFGEVQWPALPEKITLTASGGEEGLGEGEEPPEDLATNEEESDPWKVIEPWEVWYSQKMGCPVFYHQETGEKLWKIEDIGVHPGLIKALKKTEPRYKGYVDTEQAAGDDEEAPNSLQSRRKFSAQQRQELSQAVRPPPKPVKPKREPALRESRPVPPSSPGVPYTVARLPRGDSNVARIRRDPNDSSREFTFVEEGGVIELYGWDPTKKWRMCWHCYGMTHEAGMWAWVRFYSEAGQLLFHPQHWLLGTLPFGLLGIAIYEDDLALLRELTKSSVDLNEEDKLRALTPLTLAEVFGRADMLVRLLEAGAKLPPWFNRPKKDGPATVILDALSTARDEEGEGKDLDVQRLDAALEGISQEARDIAERMLDDIAEEQRVQRLVENERLEKERALEKRRLAVLDEDRELEEVEDLSHAPQEPEAGLTAQELAEKRCRELEETLRLEREKMAQLMAASVSEPEPAPAAKEPSPESIAARKAKMIAKRNALSESKAPVPKEPEKADPALVQAKIAERKRLKEEKIQKIKEAKLEAERTAHAAKVAALEAGGDYNKANREEMQFEKKMQDAMEQEEQENFLELQKAVAASSDKWTCGDCGNDNPPAEFECLFCGTERGQAKRG